MATRTTTGPTPEPETTPTRTIRIQSPAGPMHVFPGFVDDGTGDLTLTGIPEDEWGHWPPYYTLFVNGQDLGAPEIVPDGGA